MTEQTMVTQVVDAIVEALKKADPEAYISRDEKLIDDDATLVPAVTLDGRFEIEMVARAAIEALRWVDRKVEHTSEPDRFGCQTITRNIEYSAAQKAASEECPACGVCCLRAEPRDVINAYLDAILAGK